MYSSWFTGAGHSGAGCLRAPHRLDSPWFLPPASGRVTTSTKRCIIRPGNGSVNIFLGLLAVKFLYFGGSSADLTPTRRKTDACVDAQRQTVRTTHPSHTASMPRGASTAASSNPVSSVGARSALSALFSVPPPAARMRPRVLACSFLRMALIVDCCFVLLPPVPSSPRRGSK